MKTTTIRGKVYPIVEYDKALPEVKSIYDDTMKVLQLPFVLNWFKCQGSHPKLLQGNWAKLKNTLMLGEIPNILKQLIIYNVSSARNCEYCTTAHKIFADSMSNTLFKDLNFRPTEDLNSPLLPESYRLAIAIVSKAALFPQEVTEKDFEGLLNVGYDPMEVQELFSVADLVNMLNTLADISGIKVDAELISMITETSDAEN